MYVQYFPFSIIHAVKLLLNAWSQINTRPQVNAGVF